MSAQNYIRWFNELGIEDVPLVGGKNRLSISRSQTPRGVSS